VFDTLQEALKKFVVTSLGEIAVVAMKSVSRRVGIAGGSHCPLRICGEFIREWGAEAAKQSEDY